jgi:hypothetical protein
VKLQDPLNRKDNSMKQMKMILFLACLLAFSIAGIAQEDEEYEAWMETVSATVPSLRKNLEAKSGDAAAADAKKLQDVFAQVHAFWQKKNVADAMQFAMDAQTNFGSAAELASAGKFDEATAAVAKAQTTCMGCHSAHRERTPEGEWRIK